MSKYIYVDRVPGPYVRVRVIEHPQPVITERRFMPHDAEAALAYASQLQETGDVVTSSLDMTDVQRQAKRDRDTANLSALMDRVRNMRGGA